MGRSVSFWSRKLHRWGVVIVALPFLLILGTGMLLQFKKEAAWIQPPTLRGVGGDPAIGFAAILSAAMSAREAEIEGWEDVDRLDVRPSHGLVKVQSRNGVEVQVDTSNGAVLQVMKRRSDLIETLHDGSWFHANVKLWLFFPVAIVLVVMWLTGMQLWLLPHWARRRKRRAQR